MSRRAPISRLAPLFAPRGIAVVGASRDQGKLGADFARSHTGALATSWRTTRAALRQAGAVVVDDERELTDAVTALSEIRLPPGALPAASPGVGVVTAQAGPGLLHVDGLRARGVAGGLGGGSPQDRGDPGGSSPRG